MLAILGILFHHAGAVAQTSVRVITRNETRDKAPPAPNHGFSIDLDAARRSYLYVDSAYNVLDYVSSDQVVQEGLDDVPRRYVRTYTNPFFGYAVRIPKGLVGEGSAPPAPNHGFSIDLDAAGRSYLYVDGAYNVLGYTSSDQAVQEYLDDVKSEHYSQLRIIGTTHPTLCGLKATRLVLQYSGGSNMVVTEEMVLAVTSSNEQTGIVYTAGLVATDGSYARAIRILSAVLDSFECFQPTE